MTSVVDISLFLESAPLQLSEVQWRMVATQIGYWCIGMERI